ncbi:MAG: glycosyltransferase [Bacteroidetes bacterium]|nr:glycosyltransferase [Bacteroidota bacterium]
MKILYLSDHGPYASTFIRQDVEQFARTQQAHYGCFVADKDYSGKTIASTTLDYPVASLKTRILARLENADIYFSLRDRDFARRLQGLIDSQQPDIIHIQFAYEGFKFFDNIETTLPVVVNFRGYDASSKLRYKRYAEKLKQVLSRPNVFPVFVCEALRGNLEQHGISVRPDHLILYTGIQLHRFKKTNYSPPAIPTFVQVSSFELKKGHEITLRAFAKMLAATGRRDVRMILIGTGPTLEATKELVVALGLSGLVDFPGKKGHDEIIPYLDNATAFVHHSLTAANGNMEGIPNAVIEAMAMELPVLTTYHAGIPEAVEPGVNGLLCAEGDIDTYALQMAEILTWGYKKENRERVERQFSFEKHVQKLESFYKFVMSENQKQRK